MPLMSASRLAHGWTVADLDAFDPRAVLFRVIAWTNRSRLRRHTIYPMALIQAWIIGTTWAAPQAAAATATTAGSAIAWTGVTDADGIPVASYMFSTDHGSLWHSSNVGVAPLIQAEFGLWLMIVTFAIWFICWALSFNWLNLLGTALQNVSTGITEALSAPVILSTAVTIGAVPVIWFMLRGHIGKGVAQICVMLVIGLLGGTVLANPVAQIIGADGFLAQSRDAGIALSTSFTGDASANGSEMIKTFQGQFVTAFIRTPLQDWNFGAVVDDQSPQCAAAWSAAQQSGVEDNVKDFVADCGAPNAEAMKHVADNPSGPQLGTGFMLIFFSSITLAFAVVLAGLVMLAACEAILAGFKLIFGFAITGFIYGAGQAALVYAFIDMMLCVIAMAVFVIFISAWSLIITSIITSNKLSGAAGVAIAGIMQMIAIVLLIRHHFRRKKSARTTSAKISALTQNSTTPREPVKPIQMARALNDIVDTGKSLYHGAESAAHRVHGLLGTVNKTASDPGPRDTRKPMDTRTTSQPLTSAAEPVDARKATKGGVRSLAPVAKTAVAAGAAAASGGTTAIVAAAGKATAKKVATDTSKKVVTAAARKTLGSGSDPTGTRPHRNPAPLTPEPAAISPTPPTQQPLPAIEIPTGWSPSPGTTAVTAAVPPWTPDEPPAPPLPTDAPQPRHSRPDGDEAPAAPSPHSAAPTHNSLDIPRPQPAPLPTPTTPVPTPWQPRTTESAATAPVRITQTIPDGGE